MDANANAQCSCHQCSLTISHHWHCAAPSSCHVVVRHRLFGFGGTCSSWSRMSTKCQCLSPLRNQHLNCCGGDGKCDIGSCASARYHFCEPCRHARYDVSKRERQFRRQLLLGVSSESSVDFGNEKIRDQPPFIFKYRFWTMPFLKFTFQIVIGQCEFDVLNWQSALVTLSLNFVCLCDRLVSRIRKEWARLSCIACESSHCAAPIYLGRFPCQTAYNPLQTSHVTMIGAACSSEILSMICM